MPCDYDTFIVHAWYILCTDAFLLAFSCAFSLCLFFLVLKQNKKLRSECGGGGVG